MRCAPGRGAVSDDDTVESHVGRRRNVDREPFGARWIEEDAFRKSPQPAFRSPDLLSRFLDASPEPARPAGLDVASVGKCAMLIREDDHVLLEYDQYVGQLLPDAAKRGLALIPVEVGVAPRRQERAIAEIVEVTLRLRGTRTSFNPFRLLRQ